MNEVETCFCEKCRGTRPIVDQLTLYVFPTNWPFALLFAVIVVAFGKVCQVESWFVDLMAFIATFPTLLELGFKPICKICRESLAESLEGST